MSIFLADAEIIDFSDVQQTTASEATIQFESSRTISVSVNGTLVSFANGATPFLESARTMIPVRGVFEQMGYEVSWDNSVWTSTDPSSYQAALITISSGSNYLKNPITITKNNLIMQNGSEIISDVAPMLVDGNYYLPIRAIAEATGATVDWDNDTSTVIIDFTYVSAPSTSTGTSTGSTDASAPLGTGGGGADQTVAEGAFTSAALSEINATLASLSGADATAYYKYVTEQTNFNNDIIYYNAPADNAHGLPVGSYYLYNSSMPYGGTEMEYETGGFTLTSGSIYIGQTQADVRSTFGEPSASKEGRDYYESIGLGVSYTTSGRVCQIDVICRASNNYVNSGISWGSGDIVLGQSAEYSDLGPGEDWNSGSPTGGSLTIGGVTIATRYGIVDGKWEGLTLEATGLS